MSPLELAVAATGFAALVAMILGGLALIRRVYRDVHGHEDAPPDDPLQALRAAYDAGHMDDAEFRRVLESLGRPEDYLILRRHGPEGPAKEGAKTKPPVGDPQDEGWP